MTNEKYNDKNGRRIILAKVKDTLSKDNLSKQDCINAAADAAFRLERPKLALGILALGFALGSDLSREYMDVLVFGGTPEDRLYSLNMKDTSKPYLKLRYNQLLANVYFKMAPESNIPSRFSWPAVPLLGDDRVSYYRHALKHAKDAGMDDLVSKITPELEKSELELSRAINAQMWRVSEECERYQRMEEERR
jgi:hypothetical protein